MDALAETPGENSGSTGFYPLSKFSVFKNVLRSNLVLKFPDFLWASRNFFKLQWTLLRSLRRLKNVIVIKLNPDQETRLRRSFQLFDFDEDGILQIDELKQVRL